MSNWKIIYYETDSRTSPVFDFIQSLGSKAKAKVINALDLLVEYGIQIGPPKVKKVTSTDIWELRILGKDNIRIFYVASSGRSFLLLHGFLKKRQKTDKKEIKIATLRLKDYKSRMN